MTSKSAFVAIAVIGAAALAGCGSSVEPKIPASGVLVNQTEARPLADNFLEWEVTLPAESRGVRTITARAIDSHGNSEPRPHVIPAR